MNKIIYLVFHHLDHFEEFNQRVFSVKYFDHTSYSPIGFQSDYLIPAKSRILPLIALIGGIIGIAVTLTFQFWTAAVDYPKNISGKPFFSFLISIPVTFEFMVLLSVIILFISFLILSKSKIHNQNVEDEIKDLIFQGKAVIKVNQDVFSDDFFRRKVMQFMEENKIQVHKSYD